MKLSLATASLAALLLTSVATAEPLAVAPDADMGKLLAAQVGKTVTIKLGCNEEVTGKVVAATGDLVHLSELTGKEYFDAVVATDRIAAVVVRTR